MQAYSDSICTDVIITTNQITLAPGVQEMSTCGIYGYSESAKQLGITVQFRNKMSNTPSSITFNNVYTYNVILFTPLSITKDGFYLRIFATTKGRTCLHLHYITVGN